MNRPIIGNFRFRNTVQVRLRCGTLIAAGLMCLTLFAPQAMAQTPCVITAVNQQTGIVTAKVSATGQVFEFRLTNPALLRSLKVGLAIYADFTTRLVSVDGKTAIGTIVSLGPAPHGNVNGPVPKIEALTRQQFRALAPNQLVSYQGQTMTKAAFMAQRLEAWRQHQVKARASVQQLNAKLNQMQTEFVRKQQAELATRNAKVQAELNKIQQQADLLAKSPSYVALSREAAQLAARYAAASPAEKARLKQRATQLYNQLRQMELASAASGK